MHYIQYYLVLNITVLGLFFLVLEHQITLYFQRQHREINFLDTKVPNLTESTVLLTHSEPTETF
jgi:hypothetical protein